MRDTQMGRSALMAERKSAVKLLFLTLRTVENSKSNISTTTESWLTILAGRVEHSQGFRTDHIPPSISPPQSRKTSSKIRSFLPLFYSGGKSLAPKIFFLHQQAKSNYFFQLHQNSKFQLAGIWATVCRWHGRA